MPGKLPPAAKLSRNISTGRLPPTFSSLYRLFLRATSASVLDHRPAVRRLRKLWRPSFEGAVRVIRKLECSELPECEQEQLKHWYTVWEQRSEQVLVLECLRKVF